VTIVPLEKLPGISALARGLAAKDPAVARFLPDRPERDVVKARAALVLTRFRPRTSFDPALQPFATGALACVSTGQQAGLFTGPLLTLVKAVAARKLARELGLGALFWCASEDHDLVEVTRVVLPTAAGPKDVGPDPAPLAGNRRPVGAERIAVDVAALVAAAVNASPSGTAGDTGPLADELTALSAGKTYLDAFVATLRWLLDDPAQPIADAARLGDKPDLVPFAVRLVRERADVKRILSERAAALNASGFPLQVTQDPAALPLFALVDGERYVLKETGDRLALKGHPDGHDFEADDVVARFESGAWLPSFAALARPVAASILYPIAASILGPAEIAYWAQSYPLFEWAGVVPPVIVPRPMAAVLEPGVKRTLEKLELSFEELLGGTNAVLAARGADRARAILEGITRLRAELSTGLTALRPGLLSIDATLDKPLDTTRQNMEFALTKLHEKATAAAGRADETLTRQVTKVADALLPEGKLAERLITPLPFVLRLGREGLVGPLERELRWDVSGLQVIEV